MARKEISKLAWNSIKTYFIKTHPNVDISTLKVVKATSQVTAGTNLKVILEYVDMSVTKGAGVGIWVQPWKNYSEVFEFEGLY